MARPKIVQVDSRGQIVLPKEIREKLGLMGRSEFSLYSISEEGLFLKPIKSKDSRDSRIKA